MLPIRGYEDFDRKFGGMASAQNPGCILETMEKGTNEVQDDEGVTSARMESTRDGKL